MMNRLLVYSMSLLYLLAGINHFYNPYFYIDITPQYYGNIEFWVALSGFVEILLAIMLFFKETRKIGSWLIICMLIVFLLLIHIPMVINYYQIGNHHLWIAILRLPFQGLFLWWAYRVSKIKRLT